MLKLYDFSQWRFIKSSLNMKNSAMKRHLFYQFMWFVYPDRCIILSYNLFMYIWY